MILSVRQKDYGFAAFDRLEIVLDDFPHRIVKCGAEILPNLGVLVAHDGWFLHVLEGPEAAVREVFAGIQRDPRHAEVVKLGEEPTETRLFGRWSLGCRVASPRDAAALKAIDRRAVFDPPTAGF